MDSAEDKIKAHEFYCAAWDAIDNEDFDEALHQIEKALSLRSTAVEYHVSKAHILRYSKKIKDALHILEEVIRKTDRSTDALLLKGLIMSDMNRFEDAAHCYSQASEIQPGKEVYTLLASVELEINPTQALKSADKALLYDKNWEEAIEIKNEAKRRMAVD